MNLHEPWILCTIPPLTGSVLQQELTLANIDTQSIKTSHRPDSETSAPPEQLHAPSVHRMAHIHQLTRTQAIQETQP